MINSHTNIRGLILVSFHNLSWEFHPLQSFGHQPGQNDHHMCPFTPDRCPMPSATTQNIHWTVSSEGRDSNSEYNIWLNFLLACFHPSFLAAWKSVWGTGAGAGPVCSSASFPALLLLCSAPTREMTFPGCYSQASCVRQLLTHFPNRRHSLAFGSGRKGEAQLFLPLLSVLGDKWQHLLMAPVPTKSACHHSCLPSDPTLRLG